MLLEKQQLIILDLIIRTRDKLSHVYIAIEKDILWDTVVSNLPSLKEGIIRYFK